MPVPERMGFDQLNGLGTSCGAFVIEFEAVAFSQWCFEEQFHFGFVNIGGSQKLSSDLPDLVSSDDACRAEADDGRIKIRWVIFV